jgi:hypothetical protein
MPAVGSASIRGTAAAGDCCCVSSCAAAQNVTHNEKMAETAIVIHIRGFRILGWIRKKSPLV